MNHLKIARNMAGYNPQNEEHETQHGILNALIAIAEQLEIANKSKLEVYNDGYEAGIENLEAEIEYAVEYALKKEDK